MTKSGRVVLVAALVVAAGCALAFQRPTLRVAEVRLASLSLSGGTVVVDVAVDNPNGFPIQGEEFEYALAFADDGEDGGWLTLAEGRTRRPVSIPAEDIGSVELEFPFEFAKVGAALGRLLRAGELEYRFSGELRVRTRYGSSLIPFDERGRYRPLEDALSGPDADRPRGLPAEAHRTRPAVH